MCGLCSGTSKKAGLCKTGLAGSRIKEERPCINVHLPFTASLGGKKHWLLVIVDITDHALSYLFKKKSELNTVTVVLRQDLKAIEGCW